MNATMMKRLFRAISSGNHEDLRKIASQIVQDEEKKGHLSLAKELKTTLAGFSDTQSAAVLEFKPNVLSVLPRNKKNDSPLVTYLGPEQLKHEMILPPSVEERFERIEKEYAARERLALYGLKPRSKILLYGPPGCGKTLGAQRLAWSNGLPLMKVRFDAMVSSLLGETASNMREIFNSAAQSPCVLFFDECDAIAKSRSAGQEVGEIKRVVNSFLQFLDEYDVPGLLVAATNLTNQLDPAVWRRFDDVFEIPKPGAEEIKQIVQMTLSALQTTEFDWDIIVQESAGLSAAQIVRAAQDAAKRVILSADEIISQEVLVQSIREHNGVR
ncbi:AAA family ATPase [Effusibacillus lacus]|uniref:ATPase AAA n=1 Tax=Effusibacillus lacus TaxID=1348429 RepID=A0A292YJK8_9BACL|nr:ATP-binding protein [Effusibacillus lacus]TCS75140.1 ATPase family protein associated with various cellular activities (AAA) [Effusibacillus lacus]GAX89091.1 ATPase AAA [Effusibacillus lacus]